MTNSHNRNLLSMLRENCEEMPKIWTSHGSEETNVADVVNGCLSVQTYCLTLVTIVASEQRLEEASGCCKWLLIHKNQLSFSKQTRRKPAASAPFEAQNLAYDLDPEEKEVSNTYGTLQRIRGIALAACQNGQASSQLSDLHTARLVGMNG